MSNSTTNKSHRSYLRRSHRQPQRGVIYPGYTLGSEKEWLLQETSLYLNYSTPILQNLVFNNVSFDVSQFDFGADVDKVDAIASPLIDGISTDLSAFRKRGGR